MVWSHPIATSSWGEEEESQRNGSCAEVACDLATLHQEMTWTDVNGSFLVYENWRSDITSYVMINCSRLLGAEEHVQDVVPSANQTWPAGISPKTQLRFVAGKPIEKLLDFPASHVWLPAILDHVGILPRFSQFEAVNLILAVKPQQMETHFLLEGFWQPWNWFVMLGTFGNHVR